MHAKHYSFNDIHAGVILYNAYSIKYNSQNLQEQVHCVNLTAED